MDMKKWMLFSALIFLTATGKSQNLTLIEGQPTMVYALPRTELQIEIISEKTIRKPGVFYRYSERYLATKDVITAEETNYRIKEIHIRAHAIPDPARTFSVSAETCSNYKIAVNGQGIITGINIQTDNSRHTITPPRVPQLKPATSNNIISKLLPLGEEYMMAGSEAKMAEGAAKQIYRIRESRLGLLTADVEKLPADGSSLKMMLEGMNKMENDLTELFVGKTTVETSTAQLTLVPDSTLNDRILFRFSLLRGLVSANDLSGIPYYISITPTVIQTVPAKSKSVRKEELYSILPASTNIVIRDEQNTYASAKLFIPQFGKLIPLPENIRKGKETKVRIDTETGRLLDIL